MQYCGLNGTRYTCSRQSKIRVRRRGYLSAGVSVIVAQRLAISCQRVIIVREYTGSKYIPRECCKYIPRVGGVEGVEGVGGVGRRVGGLDVESVGGLDVELEGRSFARRMVGRCNLHDCKGRSSSRSVVGSSSRRVDRSSRRVDRSSRRVGGVCGGSEGQRVRESESRRVGGSRVEDRGVESMGGSSKFRLLDLIQTPTSDLRPSDPPTSTEESNIF